MTLPEIITSPAFQGPLGASVIAGAAAWAWQRRLGAAVAAGVAPADAPSLPVARRDRLVEAALVLTTLALYFVRLPLASLDPLEGHYLLEMLEAEKFDHSPIDDLILVWGHAPLYHELVAAISRATLEEAWLRLPSALAGALLVLVSWELARSLTGRIGVAHLAAAWVAVCPLAVYYSGNATPYALCAAASAASVLCVVRAPSSRSDAAWLAGYAIFAAVAFYLHVFALGIALAAGGGVALGLWGRGAEGRRRIGRIGVAVAGIVAACAPWFPAILRGYTLSAGAAGQYDERAADGMDWAYVLEELAAMLTGAPPAVVWLTLVPIGLAAVGAVGLARRDRARAAIVLALAGGGALAYAVLVIALGVRAGAYGVLNTRYLIFTLPALGILVAGGLAAISARSRIAAHALAGAVLGGALVWDAAGLPDAFVMDMEGAAADVRSRLRDGDAVLVFPTYPIFQAYLHASGAFRRDLSAEAGWHPVDGADGRWYGPVYDEEDDVAVAAQSLFIQRLWIVDHAAPPFGRRRANRTSAGPRLERLRGYGREVRRVRFPGATVHCIEKAPSVWSSDRFAIDLSDRTGWTPYAQRQGDGRWTVRAPGRGAPAAVRVRVTLAAGASRLRGGIWGRPLVFERARDGTLVAELPPGAAFRRVISVDLQADGVVAPLPAAKRRVCEASDDTCFPSGPPRGHGPTGPEGRPTEEHPPPFARILFELARPQSP